MQLLVKNIDFSFLTSGISRLNRSENHHTPLPPCPVRGNSDDRQQETFLGFVSFWDTGSYYVCQADLQLLSFCLRLFLELELQSCTSMPSPTVDVWINPDWLCLFAFHFLVLRKLFGPNIGVKKGGKINFCTVEYGKLHGDPPNARLEWSLPNITEIFPPWKLCSVDHFWKVCVLQSVGCVCVCVMLMMVLKLNWKLKFVVSKN